MRDDDDDEGNDNDDNNDNSSFPTTVVGRRRHHLRENFRELRTLSNRLQEFFSTMPYTHNKKHYIIINACISKSTDIIISSNTFPACCLPQVSLAADAM